MAYTFRVGMLIVATTVYIALSAELRDAIKSEQAFFFFCYNHQTMQLILASASKGRKQLLELFHIPFKVMVSDIDEDAIHGSSPFESIKLRAKLKGEKIAAKLITDPAKRGLITDSHLILSADSDAIIDNKIIGKAKNEKEAKRILQGFSEKTHEFYTWIYALKIENKKIIKVWETYDKSLVTMRKLTDEDIARHLKLSNYKAYAGAYALFASPIDLISKVEGSLTNVVGLPLEKLIPILKENNLL